MDNLSAHKGAGVVEAIRAVGASVLCLPAYSPDLNPTGWYYTVRVAVPGRAALTVTRLQLTTMAPTTAPHSVPRPPTATQHTMRIDGR